MKLPGTCLAYSLIMLLGGQTVKSIHLGLLFVNCLSLVLLFLIARKWLNPRAGLIAALTYAILSLSPTVLGFAAHATHFVVLAALAGTYLLLLGRERQRLPWYWGGGLLMGLAFLMKQPGIFFVFWGGFLILSGGLRTKPVSLKPVVRRLLVFAAAAVLPYTTVLLLAWLTGAFDKFWFWTFQYAVEYGCAVPVSGAVKVFITSFPRVIKGFEPVWIMGLLGLLSLCGDKRLKEVRWPILTFTLASWFAVCPGFYFRPHYFIVFLPALALAVAIFIDTLLHYLSRKFSYPSVLYIPFLIFFSAIILGIIHHWNYFFLEKPAVVSRTVYGANPFVESVKIAEFLKSRTDPGDKIAILGSEPQIFFYAHRRSATGFIYTYGLMEAHQYRLRLQQEMIGEIERASPKYLIFIKVNTSWLVQPDSARLIFQWFTSYSRKYYDLVARVDIISPGETRYLWGDAAKTAPPESPFSILIFARKRLE